MSDFYGVLKGLKIYDENFNNVDVLIVSENPNNLSLDSAMGSLALCSGDGKIYKKRVSDWAEISSFDIDVFDFKSSVIAATTETDGNINLNNYSGTIDGKTLVNNGRYLIKNQTNKAQNGIYVYNSSNNSFTRSSDADTSEKVTAGMVVPVSEGDENKNLLFILTTPDPIVLGTTELNFMAIGLYKAGNGIQINGNVINVLIDGNYGLQFVSGKLAIKNDSSSIVFNSSGELQVRNYKKMTGTITQSNVFQNVDSVALGNSNSVKWVLTLKKDNAIYSAVISATSISTNVDSSVSSILKININGFTVKPSINVVWTESNTLVLLVKTDAGVTYYLTRDVNE